MRNMYINACLCVVSGSYLQSAWLVVPPGVCQPAAACVEPEGEHSPGSAAECLEADWRAEQALIGWSQTSIYHFTSLDHCIALLQNLRVECDNRRNLLYNTKGWRSSHLSCVLIWLFADFNLTMSLGCLLAWKICLNTPVGAETKRCW